MDKLLLKFVLFLAKIFTGKQVDFNRLKIITETKILMDRRRQHLNLRPKQQTEKRNPLFSKFLIYGLMGLFYGGIVFAISHIDTAMILLHSYLLFMMTMTMITDFSSVLLDTTDNMIILPKPVNSHTLFVARLIHTLVYILQFTLVFTIFPIIITFIKYGILTGMACTITLLLTSLFAVFLTYLLYITILRFGNEQKIKDIVSYFQIVMAFAFSAGFQLISRFIKFENLDTVFHLQWHSFLLPPVWMAMAVESIYAGAFDKIHVIMILLALAVPTFTFWLMIKYLAPSFSLKLEALANDSTGQTKNFVFRQSKSLSEKLSAIFCKTKTEAASFETVWKITARDKGFKIQFYPGIGYIFVIIFISVFRKGEDIMAFWKELPTTKMYLSLIYIPLFSVFNSREIITASEKFEASWIYLSAPVARPGQIISGALKSLFIKFFTPVYLALFSLALFVWGINIIDDFAFGFFSCLFMFLIAENLGQHYLPFSVQPNIKVKSGNFVRAILLLTIIAALIAFHFFITKINWLIYALIPVAFGGCYFLTRRIQKLPWLKISF